MEKIKICYLLAILGFILVVLAFIIEFYNLKKYKKCVKINFQETYCKKYTHY